MLPVIPKPPLTRGQKHAALFIAGCVDILQVGLFPILGVGYILDDVLDLIAAAALTAICGFKWQFAAAFMLELIPVFDILPTWTAVVMLMPSASPPVAQGRVHVTAVQVEDPPRYSGNGVAVDVEAEVIPTPPPRVPPVQPPPGASK